MIHFDNWSSAINNTDNPNPLQTCFGMANSTP